MSMGTLFSLGVIDAFDVDALEDAILKAPEVDTFRDAIGEVIRAIHGLPDVLECDLKQVEVYLGRTGYDPDLLRNRWKFRFNAFESAPSSHAMILFRGSTARIRNQHWERFAQKVIGALHRNSALCCANAVAGSNGPWATTRQTVIYLVARKRPGRIGELSDAAVNQAIRELTTEREIEPDALIEASRLIPDPYERHDHEIAEVPDSTPEIELDARTCKEEGCTYAARPGNFGFCGYHRRVPTVDKCKREGCNFLALEGNYGFCGRHRSPFR